jgi:hypothetical protein
MFNKARLCRCGVVASFLAFLVAATASAQMTMKAKTVAPWTFCTLKVQGDTPVLFTSMQPLDLAMEQYEICESGVPAGWIAIFPTGQPNTIIYIDAIRNGPPGGMPVHVRLKVTVTEGGPGPGPSPGPSPGPTPGPQPELKGLAKQIYELAQPLGDPTTAHKISGAYAAVASAIAAGGIGTVKDAHEAITEQMQGLGKLDGKWKPVGEMARKALNQFGQTLLGAKNTMAAIANGLEAVR